MTNVIAYLKENERKLMYVAGAMLAMVVAKYVFDIQAEGAVPFLMIGALDDFGESFAAKAVRRFYQNAVTPAITNSQYEGDIQKAGDRLNILSFPGDMQLQDYVAGTDMSVDRIFDLEDQLVVEKRKASNFPIDRLEELFTYVDDAADTLVESVSKSVEREIDTYVLGFAQFAKAGSWIGIDVRVVGSSADTEASVATTATGGNITIATGSTATGTNDVATVEHGDGTVDFAGFNAADVGKPIRLTSGTTWATEWYRITTVTDSVTVAVQNWDAATEAPDIPQGDVLRGLYGAFSFTGGAINGDGKPTTQAGWGWELQAGRATTIASGTIYEQMVTLAEKLDENEVPDTDRHVTVTPGIVAILKQASELQPAISMAYEDVILNGRVGRVGGFDIHMAAGSRVTTRLARPTASSIGADVVLTDGARAHQVLGNHISYCTFAYKWSESRIVEAEDQFATKYQALSLFGAVVPGIRRRSGALLFGTV